MYKSLRKLTNRLLESKHVRSFSYYITTPIFYANSSPHIGHVHTLLLADAINIYQRIKLNTNDTIFSTGTDEHGIKIQTAAEAQKIDYQTFCNQNSQKFIDLFACYDTTLTDFVRTSRESHKNAVISVWNELEKQGFIYKNNYSGWYCTTDETFVPESQVTKRELDGGRVVHVDQNENQLLWSSEENYMFRLSDFEDKVCDWLTNEKPILPQKFNHEAIHMLKRSPIGDISISRPYSRLDWGIRVPNDPDQTVYVWLDALTNYLSVAGYPCTKDQLKRWPIDCQVIGKDIIKFHAIYWPAFLLALSLPLPKKIICHSHWLVDSLKMSKSRGNVIDPSGENRTLTAEGLRYYLLRAATTHSDTDYSITQAVRRVNAELADTYGNLMNRCCAPAINPNQIIPTKLIDVSCPKIFEIKNHLDRILLSCEKHYECADFYKAVDEIMHVLRLNNGLYEENKPWKLVKEIESNEKSYIDYFNLQTITFETLRICSILLQPVIPKISNLALDRLNVVERSWNSAQVSIEFGDPKLCQRMISKKSNPILFRRIKPN